MTQNPTHSYTVQMLPGLADELDYSLSPADGIVALGELHVELPRLHARLPRRIPDPGEWPYYFGRYGWYPLGFTYVEVGATLLIVQLWTDQLWDVEREHEVDCVLVDQTDAVVPAQDRLVPNVTKEGMA